MLSRAGGFLISVVEARRLGCGEIIAPALGANQGAILIFHITSRRAWDEAQERGSYHAESLATEGFIHCSTVSQVLPVAENFYKGQSGLILLAVEPTLLSSALKWEPPSGGSPPPGVSEGDLFPHIYGPLNLDAVVMVNVIDLVSDSDGLMVLIRQFE